MWMHSNLLVPAILDVTLRPLLSFASPLLIERWLHLDALTSPVSHAFAELCVDTSSLLFSLPIETVRRRLQVQRRRATNSHVSAVQAGLPPSTPTKSSKGKGKETAATSSSTSTLAPSASGNTGTLKGLRTCVETRPKPYVGVVEAIYRILTEETAYASSSSAPAAATGAKGKGKQEEEKKRSAGGWQRQHQRTETEETNTAAADGTPQRPGSHPMMGRSEILAPQRPTYATLGGLRSLYRGFTMAAGANLVVFLLTVVTGERVQTTGSGVGGVGGGAGLWAEI